MSSSERELQEEIEDLRGELGETVQALAYKTNLPARAKERGNQWKDDAIARGSELGYQALERSGELRNQVAERGNELKDRVVGRGKELRVQAVQRGDELKNQAIAAAGMTREAVSGMPAGRWAMLVGAGLTLVVLTVIVRKVRIR